VVTAIAACSGLLAASLAWGVFLLLTRRQRRLRERLKQVAGQVAGAGTGAGTPDGLLASSGAEVQAGSEGRSPTAQGRSAAQQTGRRRIRLPAIPVLPGALGRKYAEKARIDLMKSGVPLKPEELAGMSAVLSVLGAVAGLLSPGGALAATALGAAGLLLPGQYVGMAKRRRAAKLESQLVDALTLIANALRAGHSFMQALELVCRDMAPPLAPELARVLKEAKLGLSIDEAFGKLVSRFESRDLELVVTGVLIQRQIGGNLASVLDSIASTIEKRLKARARVRALTAQGRLSAWVVSMLPFALSGLVFGAYPEFGRIMLVNPIGIAMLAGAALLLVIGIFIIRKVVNVDV